MYFPVIFIKLSRGHQAQPSPKFQISTQFLKGTYSAWIWDKNSDLRPSIDLRKDGYGGACSLVVSAAVAHDETFEF